MAIRDSILFATGAKKADRRYHEAGVRGRFENNLRIERGSIDTTGPTVVFGVGFTVAKNGVGDVTITVDPPFSDTPSVTATAVGGGIPITIIVSRDTSTARLNRYSIGAAANADGVFDFTLTGPA